MILFPIKLLILNRVDSEYALIVKSRDVSEQIFTAYTINWDSFLDVYSLGYGHLFWRRIGMIKPPVTLGVSKFSYSKKRTSHDKM
mgnify:CR=1 FL=1